MCCVTTFQSSALLLYSHLVSCYSHGLGLPYHKDFYCFAFHVFVVLGTPKYKLTYQYVMVAGTFWLYLYPYIFTYVFLFFLISLDPKVLKKQSLLHKLEVSTVIRSRLIRKVNNKSRGLFYFIRCLKWLYHQPWQ